MRKSLITCTFLCLLLSTVVVGLEMPGFDNSQGKTIQIEGQFIVRFADNVDLNGVTKGFDMFRLGVSSVDKLFDDFKAEEVEVMFPRYLGESSTMSRYYLVNIPKSSNDEAFMEAMAANPNVASIEHDIACMIAVTNNDPVSQWQLYQASRIDIHVREAWDIETGSDDIILGIIDTGVNYRHNDLKNNIWINPGEDIDNDKVVFDSTDFNQIDDDGNGYIDDVIGYDFFNGGSEPAWVDPSDGTAEDPNARDNDPNDYNGHGTHVSGIASAATNNSTNGAGPGGGWGPSWRGRGVQIMCLRAGYSAAHPVYGYETGYLVMSAVAQALDYAANNGADIISYSAGSSYTSALASATMAAVNAGISIFHAAGNDGSSSSGGDFFASHPNVITVASINSGGTKAGSSNYGYWIEIAAPGEGIYSTYSHHYNPTTATMSGTSMASPCAAGVAALVKSHFPDYDNTVLNTLLPSMADPLTGDYYYNEGWMGGGLVNAFNCLDGAPVAKLSASPLVGVAPLTVNFSDESPAATSWSWTFGDGGVSGDQYPQYTYNDPGLYDVSLEVDDPNGTHKETQKYLIFVADDSLYGNDINGTIGSSFAIPIKVKNTLPLVELWVVLDHGDNLDYDSFSVAGTRGESFDYIQVVNQFQTRLAVKCVPYQSTGQDPLLPGDETIFNLWVTGVGGSSTVVDTATLSGKKTKFVSIFHEYEPAFQPINIIFGIRGDANSDGSVNLADAGFIINYIFYDGPEPSAYEGDANADGSVNLGDTSYIINYIFYDGPPPPP